MRGKFITFGVGIALTTSVWASSAVAQSLGSAQSYGVLAGSGVTAAGGAGTVISGDVGSSPTASVTGFPPAVVTAGFAVHGSNDASNISAQAATTSLYSSLSSGACTDNPGPQMSGANFGPGVHCFSSTADLAAGGTLTLTGAGTYIFRVGSALNANTGSSVSLAGGVNPCTVFWQVTSAAALNGSSFAGNVVTQAGVHMGPSASLSGRALATSAGDVTLAGSNTVGGCSAAAPPPPCPVITLAPTTMPNGTVGVAYSQTISGSGGAAPYVFAVTAGTLPAGTTLTAAGVLAGTPTTAGTSTVTIRGTDANGCFATVAYTIVIAAAAPPPCPVITLAPPTMPSGTVGVAYSQTISGSGGAAPYVFAVTAGTLPAGTTLTPTGVLAGTPTTAGTSTVTIRGTDANGCLASVTYTIVIAAAPPPPPVCPAITLAPPTLPSGTVGVAYSQTIVGSGGTAPYVFGVTAGALPAGTTLTPTGVLAGTPTAAGTSTVTIRGTDANGCFKELAYTIVIAAAPPPPPVCPAITLAPPTLPNGTIGVAYSQTIVGSGGTAPYVFGVTAGALPAGTTLTPTGVLAGTPTVAGTSTVTIRGTDANGCFKELVYTIVIAAAPPPPPVCPVITLSPPTLPNGTIGVAYSQTIVGSGGTAPYVFGVTAGALPAGTTLTPTGVLAGTPTTAGTSTVTIRGTDANGCFKELVYTIVIAAAPPPPPVCPVITLSPPTLPNGTIGVAYSQTIVGSGGTAPYVFGVTAGALPAGTTLTPTGVLAGTPTTAGTSTVTIRGTDANGCFKELSFTIIIAAAPVPPPVCAVITLTPVTLDNGTVGLAYSQALSASGGAGPYTFSVLSGSLPPGVILTTVGTGAVLSGTPTTAGTASFTIRATDASGCFADRSFTVLSVPSVPTVPQFFLVLFVAGLAALGYFQLRRPARS